MKLKVLFAIIAGVFGVFYGALAGLVSAGVTAGAFWLFIFGDNSWPAYTSWVICIVFAVWFLAVFSAMTWAGYMFGKATDALSGPERAANIKKFIIACIAATAFLTFVFISHMEDKRRADASIAQNAAKEARLKEYRQAVKFEDVTVAPVSEQGFNLVVAMDCRESGEYKPHVTIDLLGPRFEHTFPAIRVAAGKTTQEIFISYAQIVTAYNEKGINPSATGNRLSADFHCIVELVPVLAAEQMGQLPDYLQYTPSVIDLRKDLTLPLLCTYASGTVDSCCLDLR